MRFRIKEIAKPLSAAYHRLV